MAEIVLKELSQSDIEWMMATGLKLELAAADVLLETGAAVHTLYLVLTGSLALVMPGKGRYREISVLSRGDVIGTSFLLNTYPLPFTVQAREKTVVLAVPQQQLSDKLAQDLSFSTRFYRAIALLLYERQKGIAAKMPPALIAPSFFDKSILSVFSCLNDLDICWLSNRGHVEKFDRDSFCIKEGKSLEALYVLLKGSMDVLVDGEEKALPVAAGNTITPIANKVAEVMPGEIIGITQFLGLGANPYTMQASTDSLMLSIPIPLLNKKLRDDLGFAARFYRALASLTMERTYQILIYLRDDQMDTAETDLFDLNTEDELNIDALQRMSVARAKFNWLLQYLNVKV